MISNDINDNDNNILQSNEFDQNEFNLEDFQDENPQNFTTNDEIGKSKYNIIYENIQEPIYNNLFFSDIKNKVNKYINFRNECIEIAILAKYSTEKKLELVSMIDPDPKNMIPLINDAFYIDSNDYTIHLNNNYTKYSNDFLEIIQINSKNINPLYIIFKGYTYQNIELRVNNANPDFFSKLSIKFMFFIQEDSFNTLNKNIYNKKNNIFSSYLHEMKDTKKRFYLDKTIIDSFIDGIKEIMQTDNKDLINKDEPFVKINPIIDLKSENFEKNRIDYMVINGIIFDNIFSFNDQNNNIYIKNFNTRFLNIKDKEKSEITEENKSDEYNLKDYIYYFKNEARSYTLYDLIKDSFVTVNIDKIIFGNNMLFGNKKVKLNTNESLANLNVIFDIPYFKEIIYKNKSIKIDKNKVNVLFIFYEKILKYISIIKQEKDEDNIEILEMLRCIFYHCSIQFIYNPNEIDDKYKGKYEDIMKKIMQINIIDNIHTVLKNFKETSNYSYARYDEICKKYKTQIRYVKLYNFLEQKNIIKLTKTKLQKFIVLMDNIIYKNKIDIDSQIIRIIEKESVSREKNITEINTNQKVLKTPDAKTPDAKTPDANIPDAKILNANIKNNNNRIGDSTQFIGLVLSGLGQILLVVVIFL